MDPHTTPEPERTATEPAGTAEALLRTARRLFAHQGYDATSVRQITAEAGANLGAVTYHFGSKQELYHAVLREALAPLAGRVIAAAQAPGAPLDRAEEVVRAYFDVLSRHPDVPFLLIQEMMAQREAPAPVTNTLRAISGTLAAMIVEGQQDGTIRPGDPLLLALSIVAQPVQMSVVAKVLAQVVGVDTRDAATRARVQAHSAAFVRAGLHGEGADA